MHCILYFKLAVIPILQTERLGAYSASIVTPTAFAPPLSHSKAWARFPIHIP